MKRGGFLKRKTPLRSKGKSDVSQIKDDIQRLLRALVIRRDGGCFLRHYDQAGQCGGYTKDGILILQAEHLVTRAHSASYGDDRLVVCCCQRHHIFWKKQNPALYYTLVRDFIGPERSALLERVLMDERAHKPTRTSLYDWQKVAAFLTTKIRALDPEWHDQ